MQNDKSARSAPHCLSRSLQRLLEVHPTGRHCARAAFVLQVTRKGHQVKRACGQTKPPVPWHCRSIGRLPTYEFGVGARYGLYRRSTVTSEAAVSGAGCGAPGAQSRVRTRYKARWWVRGGVSGLYRSCVGAPGSEPFAARALNCLRSKPPVSMAVGVRLSAASSEGLLLLNFRNSLSDRTSNGLAERPTDELHCALRAQNH